MGAGKGVAKRVQVKVIVEHPWFFGWDCKVCHSKLEAEASDIEIGYFGANYGGETPDKKYYVICPVCGTNEIVPDVKLTNMIIDDVEASKGSN